MMRVFEGTVWRRSVQGSLGVFQVVAHTAEEAKKVLAKHLTKHLNFSYDDVFYKCMEASNIKYTDTGWRPFVRLCHLDTVVIQRFPVNYVPSEN